MRKLLLLIYTLLQVSLCQAENKSFSRIDLSGGILINSNRNLIHQYWNPQKGFSLLANTPFYFGNIEAGMFFMPFKHLSVKNPSYNNYFFFLGFSKEVIIPLSITISSGVRFGSDVFSFSDDSLSSYESVESELGVDLFAAGKLPLYKGFHLNLSMDYLGILTNRPIRLIFISAGLGYEFKTPLWLKEFLK